MTAPGRVRRADGLHWDWCVGPHESFLCITGKPACGGDESSCFDADCEKHGDIHSRDLAYQEDDLNGRIPW